jgi:hypothetical protein
MAVLQSIVPRLRRIERTTLHIAAQRYLMVPCTPALSKFTRPRIGWVCVVHRRPCGQNQYAPKCCHFSSTTNDESTRDNKRRELEETDQRFEAFAGGVFSVGQRVQLSELGRARSSRSPTNGVVVTVNRRSSGGPVTVLMDGNKRPQQIHSSYLEPEAKQSPYDGASPSHR